MASGRPPSRRTSSARTGTSAGSTGWRRTCRSRSKNKDTAGYAESSARSACGPRGGTSSGATGHATMPATSTGCRLVTRIRRPGALARSQASAVAVAAGDRSALSTSSRVGWPAHRSGRSAARATPNTDAAAARMSSGAETSETKMPATPPGNRSLTWCTTDSARQVLPTPPSPISSTTSLEATRPHTSRTSSSRPTSGSDGGSAMVRGGRPLSPEPAGSAAASSSRPRAASMKRTRALAIRPSASASSSTVPRCGRVARPRSSSRTVRTPTPARAASSCWVSPDARR